GPSGASVGVASTFILEIAGPDHGVSAHHTADSWSSSGSFAEGLPFCLARSALASATRSLNCSPASEATSDSESNRYIPPLTSSLAKGRNAEPTPERKSVIGVPSSASHPQARNLHPPSNWLRLDASQNIRAEVIYGPRFSLALPPRSRLTSIPPSLLLPDR